MRTIDRADAYRLAVLQEREQKIMAQIALLQGQLSETREARHTLLAVLGLLDHTGSVITEPGQSYPVGTVLDENGQPITAPIIATEGSQ